MTCNFGSSKLLGSIGLCVAATSVAKGEGAFHIVRKGECLSQIARIRIGTPVYGPDGSLQALRELNPGISDPDQIAPGQKIMLNPKLREPASPPSQFTAPPAITQHTPSEGTFSPGPVEPQSSESQPATQDSRRPVSHLGFDLGLEYSRIDAADKRNGESATLLSNLSPFVNATWDLDWTDSWTTRLRMGARSANFRESDSPELKVSQISSTGYSAEAGIRYSWGTHEAPLTGARHRSGLSIGSREREFFRAENLNSVVLDQIQIFEVKLSHEIDFIRAGSATAGASLAATALLPTNGTGYSIAGGAAFDAAAFVRHDLRFFSISAATSYGFGSQNSSIAEQRHRNVVFTLGISRRFEE